MPGAHRPRPNPYLHIAEDRLFNPHADATLTADDNAFAQLRTLLDDRGAVPTTLDPVLARERWIVTGDDDPDAWFLLKYVSLEAHSVCDQACSFCPVSVAPRTPHYMDTALYARIVDELAALGEPIEAVFMNGYNEPTLDPGFLDQLATLQHVGLPPALLSNGAGLTPELIAGIRSRGGLAYLAINLSTLDAERYRQQRRADALETVLANLDHLADDPIADRMDLVVLGANDAWHDDEVRAIEARFAGSPFRVQSFEANERASFLGPDARVADRAAPLRGCENMGSRPIQHLHVTPDGRCVICCQDYGEEFVVGDLTRQSVTEVLGGPELARARRLAYGLDEAPDDFICRGCRFACRG